MRRETADKAGAGSNEQFTAEASGTQGATGLTRIWLELRGCHLWICKMCHRVVWKTLGFVLLLTWCRWADKGNRSIAELPGRRPAQVNPTPLADVFTPSENRQCSKPPLRAEHLLLLSYKLAPVTPWHIVILFLFFLSHPSSSEMQFPFLSSPPSQHTQLLPEVQPADSGSLVGNTAAEQQQH